MTAWRPGWSRALGAAVLLALIASLWPAGALWLTHEAQREALSSQRLSLLQAQQEARALQQKTIPSPAEALRLIQAIGRQRFNAVPVSLPNGAVQLQLRALPAEQLALGWNEIRANTSASLTRADLTAEGQVWSGTLVFTLASRP
mgnify:FL=1